MELEEMKAIWADLSDQLEQQKKLTNEIIIKMTQQQYKAKLNKIIYPELIGTVICFAMALILIINFNKLDSTLTLVTGIITIIILVFLPIFSLRALRKLNNINLVDNNYKQTMIDYANGRKQLRRVQQVSIYISFFLMFVMVPPLTKVIKGRDFSIDASDLLIYVPIALIYFALFTSFVMRCYKGIMRSTDRLLNDLDMD